MDHTLKITLGYVLSFAYMTLVMLIGEVLNRKFRIEKELSRKISHLLSSGCWVICYFFSGPTYHTVIINAAALVLVAIAEFSGKLKFSERGESVKGYGMVFFCFSTLVAMCITVFAYPQLFATTGVAYYCLALGDGLAPIGKRIAGKYNLTVFGKKSLAGMIVVFTVSSLVALTFSCIFGLGYDALFIISLGALASVTELIGSNGTDNITVEFAVFAYAAMHLFGVVPQALEVTLIVAAAMFVVDSVKQTLTPTANIILYFYLLVSVYCMGYAFLVTAIVLFAVEAVLSRVTGKRFNRISGEETEKRSRGCWQIVANSVIVLCFTLLYKLISVRAMAFVAFTVLVEEFVDSVSSDVGKLAKAPPIDILKFRRTKAGLSGGVSVIGSLSGLAFACAGAALPFIFFAFNVRVYFIIAGVAMLGMMVDSMLGSAVQALYKCGECGNVTEHTEHCGVTAELIKGARIIDNTMVNLLSAVFCAAVAVVLLLCCGIAI